MGEKKGEKKIWTAPHILPFAGASFPGPLTKKRGFSLSSCLHPLHSSELRPTLEREREREKKNRNALPSGSLFLVLVALLDSLATVYLSESGVAFCVLNIV